MRRHQTQSSLRVAVLVSLGTWLAGCESQQHALRTVPVEFEIQLINARASAWAAGPSTGGARAGFGDTNETIKHSIYANLGDPVFCKVVGEQWDRNQPGHQVLCRILVNGEEIYMCGDQGTRDEDTKAECGGPVYIPQEEER